MADQTPSDKYAPYTTADFKLSFPPESVRLLKITSRRKWWLWGPWIVTYHFEFTPNCQRG